MSSLYPSSEDKKRMARDREVLQALAQIGELAVVRIAHVSSEGRLVAWVRDRNGKHGEITPQLDHFRSTAKFAGPLAPFTKYCGDGVWMWSIHI